MAEARGSRKPNARSFNRLQRLRPERTPVKVSYRCPRCGGPHHVDRCAHPQRVPRLR